MRLGPEMLDRLPAAVRQPAYDRDKLQVGHAHIGIGAFHRCHQLDFVDDMLEARFGPWGVVGINLRAPWTGAVLEAQHGLYTRTLREGARAETRVIGALRRVIEGCDAHAAEAVARTLASPSIQVVTMTITEKAYGLTPASGALDTSNSDIAADLGGAFPPRSALGFLALGLARRARENAGPITLISCDNIPSNGRRLRAGLLGLIEATQPALLDWIEHNVAFPNAMVDRIAPAIRAADLDSLVASLSVREEAAVFGEPFRQWVIEDRFAGERPPWDMAGVQFVADAEPYEQIKMRVLNAAQSTLSHWGALVGHEFSYEAASDAVLSGLTERMLARETLPTLPGVTGMETQPYLAASLNRIRNTAVSHRCHQIGADGSQKISQRLIAPLRARRARGEPAQDLECAVAGWIAYVAAGARRYGARWTADDPVAPMLIARAEAAADFADLARAALSLTEIFGDDLLDVGLVSRIGDHLAGLLGRDPHGHLRNTLAA